MVKSHTEWDSRSKAASGHVTERKITEPRSLGVVRVSYGCCIRRNKTRVTLGKLSFLCWQKAEVTST